MPKRKSVKPKALSREDKAALREIRENITALPKSRHLEKVLKDVGDPSAVKMIMHSGGNLKVTWGVIQPDPAPTRTPYDLVMAIGGLAVFFMVTHAFGWPL